jgi:hypothetical protein
MNLHKFFCWFDNHDWEEVVVQYGHGINDKPKFRYSRCIHCKKTENHRMVDDSLGKVDFSDLDL